MELGGRTARSDSAPPNQNRARPRALPHKTKPVGSCPWPALAARGCQGRRASSVASAASFGFHRLRGTACSLQPTAVLPQPAAGCSQRFSRFPKRLPLPAPVLFRGNGCHQLAAFTLRDGLLACPRAVLKQVRPASRVPLPILFPCFAPDTRPRTPSQHAAAGRAWDSKQAKFQGATTWKIRRAVRRFFFFCPPPTAICGGSRIHPAPPETELTASSSNLHSPCGEPELPSPHPQGQEALHLTPPAWTTGPLKEASVRCCWPGGSRWPARVLSCPPLLLFCCSSCVAFSPDRSVSCTPAIFFLFFPCNVHKHNLTSLPAGGSRSSGSGAGSQRPGASPEDKRHEARRDEQPMTSPDLHVGQMLPEGAGVVIRLAVASPSSPVMKKGREKGRVDMSYVYCPTYFVGPLDRSSSPPAKHDDTLRLPSIPSMRIVSLGNKNSTF